MCECVSSYFTTSDELLLATVIRCLFLYVSLYLTLRRGFHLFPSCMTCEQIHENRFHRMRSSIYLNFVLTAFIRTEQDAMRSKKVAKATTTITTTKNHRNRHKKLFICAVESNFSSLFFSRKQHIFYPLLSSIL